MSPTHHGEVVRHVYHKDTFRIMVVRLTEGGREASVLGHFSEFCKGAKVQIVGSESSHPTRGPQIKAELITEIIYKDTTSVEITTPPISNDNKLSTYLREEILPEIEIMFDDAKQIDMNFHYLNSTDGELRVDINILRQDGTTWTGHLNIKASDIK